MTLGARGGALHSPTCFVYKYALSPRSCSTYLHAGLRVSHVLHWYWTHRLKLKWSFPRPPFVPDPRARCTKCYGLSPRTIVPGSGPGLRRPMHPPVFTPPTPRGAGGPAAHHHSPHTWCTRAHRKYSAVPCVIRSLVTQNELQGSRGTAPGPCAERRVGNGDRSSCRDFTHVQLRHFTHFDRVPPLGAESPRVT